MKKFKLIYNPRCSKSIEAAKILEESKVEFTKIDYLSGELSENLLLEIRSLLNVDFSQMIRSKEAKVVEFLEAANFSESQWITFILENPEVLERPIFLSESQALIARPPELLREIF